MLEYCSTFSCGIATLKMVTDGSLIVVLLCSSVVLFDLAAAHPTTYLKPAAPLKHTTAAPSDIVRTFDVSPRRGTDAIMEGPHPHNMRHKRAVATSTIIGLILAALGVSIGAAQLGIQIADRPKSPR